MTEPFGYIFAHYFNEIKAHSHFPITSDTTYTSFTNMVLKDIFIRKGFVHHSDIVSPQPEIQKNQLYEIYFTNFDKLIADPELKHISDTTFEQFTELVLFKYLLENKIIYPPLNNGSQAIISKCLKDEQINIAAMTQGISIKNHHFYQTLLFKNIFKLNEFYCLLPKYTPGTNFQRSIAGINYQTKINSSSGEHMENFPCKYIAQAVFSYPVFNENQSTDIALLEDITPDLFPLWQPQNGPNKYLQEHINSEVVCFRVYEIQEDLSPSVKNPKARRPTLLNPEYVKIVSPVISDDEFISQQLLLYKYIIRYQC